MNELISRFVADDLNWAPKRHGATSHRRRLD